MSDTPNNNSSETRFDRFIDRLFSMVVMQPTTLCPWTCTYCYLTTKNQKLEMSPGIAHAVAHSIQAQGSDTAVDLLWHGGEPLSIGPQKLELLLACFEELRREGRVRHSVQTNAGLITSQWCDLLSTYGFSVGVSIDGPEWANTQRRDKAGRSTHARTMRGLQTLQAHGIPFSVIAVITTETIGRADEIIDFFESLGAQRVGFNLEEQEGANAGRPVIDRAAATLFWRTVFQRRAAGSPLVVREVEHALTYLRHARKNGLPGVALHDPIPTVAWNGDTVILSPELAGIREPAYDDFVLGNVLVDSLPDMLRRAHGMRYVDEFTQALESCAGSCEFYGFCGGSQAGNRYFEHGSFVDSETAFCVNTRQALISGLYELSTSSEE